MSNKLLHLLEDVVAGVVAVLIGIYVCLAVARAYPAMEPLSDVRMGEADVSSLPRAEKFYTVAIVKEDGTIGEERFSIPLSVFAEYII